MNRISLLFLVIFSPLLLFSKISISEQNLPSNQTTSTKFNPADIMVLLDNSGSMKKHDPRYLVKSAIKQFINGLHADSRIGIIIFDQSAKLTTPLTSISQNNQTPFVSSLDRIDYRGQLTNSPQALRLAFDELKSRGRPDTDKLIIFLTDGIIDTGNRDRDIKSASKLKNELSVEAAQLGVKIFGITLGTQADFVLMQILAEKTDGQLYRSDRAENLAFLFGQLSKTLEKPESNATASINKKATPIEDKIKADSAAIADQQKTTSTTQPKSGFKQQEKPITETTPIQQPSIVSSTEMSDDLNNSNNFDFISLTWILVFGICICVVIIGYLFIRRQATNDAQHTLSEGIERNIDLNIPKAFLIDRSGKLPKKQYDITNRVTPIGRSSGTSDPIGSLLFNSETLSRRHAIIEYKNHQYWIIDLRSTNGTFVNDKQVDTEVCLKQGDKIRFHTTELEFNLEEISQGDTTVIVSPKHKTEKTHQTQVIRFKNGKEIEDNIDKDKSKQHELNLDKATLTKLSELKGNEDRILIPGGHSESPKKPDPVISPEKITSSTTQTMNHPGKTKKPIIEEVNTLTSMEQPPGKKDLGDPTTLVLKRKQKKDRNNLKNVSDHAVESDTTLKPDGKDRHRSQTDEPR